jgi:hypothetical protein
MHDRSLVTLNSAQLNSHPHWAPGTASAPPRAQRHMYAWGDLNPCRARWPEPNSRKSAAASRAKAHFDWRRVKLSQHENHSRTY